MEFIAEKKREEHGLVYFDISLNGKIFKVSIKDYVYKALSEDNNGRLEDFLLCAVWNNFDLKIKE